MGIRIEQVDVSSLSKVFITRMELDTRVVDLVKDFLANDERVVSVNASEGIEVTGNRQNVTLSVKKATPEELGAIRVGRNLSMDEEGVLSAEDTKYQGGEGITISEVERENYRIKLAKATSGSLGGIKLGSGLIMNDEGVTSVNVTELPDAKTNIKGLVRLGNGLAFNEHTQCVDVQFKDEIAASQIAMEIAGTNLAYNTETGRIDATSYNVGEGLNIQDVGVNAKVISSRKATIDTAGIVKPGDNLSVQEDGTLDVSLPRSSKSDFGVIKLGNRLEVNPQSNAVDVNIPIANYNTLGLVKVGGKNTTINNEGVLEAIVGREDIDTLVNTIKALNVKITNMQQEIENITTILGQLDRDTVAAVYGDNFMAGTNVFNGLEGLTIELPQELSNSNYTVLINPSISTNGNLGEFWVENKTNTSFRVGSSGRLVSVKFDWILVQNESGTTRYSDSSFPVQRGTATLNDTTGVNVTLPSPMSTTDYSVFITPMENHSGVYGEVWAENKTRNGFTIKSSGGTRAKVNYFVVKNTTLPYNEQNMPMITGSAQFNNTNLVEVILPKSLATKTYQVILSPASNAAGTLGEYWVEDKSINSFRVRSTGGNNVPFNYFILGV